MFIPLNSVQENGWPRVLAIGDTATVFYLLSLLAPYKVCVFVADTGVDCSSPLQFRSGRERGAPDAAAAYYDFFDSAYRIGAGVLRRMDLLLYTACRGYVSGWARRLRVPAAFIKRRPEGAIFEVEGALPDAVSLVGSRTQDGAMAALLLGLIEASSTGRYSGTCSLVTVDGEGRGHLYPPADKNLQPEIEPEETPHSAWDGVIEVLGPGESMIIDRPEAGGPMKVSATDAPGPKLIELGVPELHIVKIYGRRERYIELTGDRERVFDGVM